MARAGIRLGLLLLGVLGGGARGEVTTRVVEDRRGGAPVVGRLVADEADRAAGRPGVLLLHEGAGDAEVARRDAELWARSGSIVLAVALDRAEGARADAALGLLRRQPGVDPRRLAVVGLGAAGRAALDLAGSGPGLRGVACVGGEPPALAPDRARRLAGRTRVLLVLDPAADRAPGARQRALEDGLRRAGVAWRIVRAHPDEAGPALGEFLDALGDRPEAAADRRPEPPSGPEARPGPATVALPRGVPARVGEVLAFVHENHRAMPGYEGGRSFGNFEGHLPRTDRQGRRVRYQEWDVYPLRSGVNRGAERLVTGSDGSAYYTRDHYDSFIKIR
jgi:dienelactone hydrolase